MRIAQICLSLILLISTQNQLDATFSDGFRKFLWDTYGPEIASNLTRLDFLERGSFGGGIRSYSQKTM